ncbi:MAG: TolC family protein, partial [Fulvivirga sp.]|uniref:TolC family protein n=1 Tax=Fulvivirga sp. TaxID=1931237 RepID=UPI0032EE10E8
MHRIKILLFLVFTTLCASGQENNVWTLQECIDYALANNITIQRSRLDLTSAEINYKQAQFNRLPNLNANGSYGFSWGRSIDPTTNLFVENQRIVSSNANVSSSVTLFNGFNINNNIKQNEYSYKATEKTVEDTENNTILNVVSFYTNVLFTKELFENSKKQLESTTQQVEITR